MYFLVCCDFLEGKCPKTAAECEFEHTKEGGKPCDKGDECPHVHYKRLWTKGGKSCQICGKLFWKVFPYRRKHHCRAAMACNSANAQSPALMCAAAMAWCTRNDAQSPALVCADCLNRDFIPYPACIPCCKLIEAEREQERAEVRTQMMADGATREQVEQYQKETRWQEAAQQQHVCFDSDDEEEEDNDDEEDEAVHNLRDLLFGETKASSSSAPSALAVSAQSATPSEEEDIDIELLFRPLVGVRSFVTAPAAAASSAYEEDIELLFRPPNLESSGDDDQQQQQQAVSARSYSPLHHSPRRREEDDEHLSPAWERAKRRIRCLPPVLRMANAAAKGRRSQLELDEEGRLRAEKEETDDICDLFRGGTFRDADEARKEMQRHQRELNENLFVNSTSRSWMMSYQSPTAAKKEQEERERAAAELRERQLEQYERMQAQRSLRAATPRKTLGSKNSFRRSSLPPEKQQQQQSPPMPVEPLPAGETKSSSTFFFGPENKNGDDKKEEKKKTEEVVDIATARQRRFSVSKEDEITDARQLKAMAKVQEFQQEKSFKKLFRRFGVEMLVGLILVASLAASIGYLIRFSVNNFTLFRECHECFDQDGVAYNEDTNDCIFEYNLTSSSSFSADSFAPFSQPTSTTTTLLPPTTVAAESNQSFSTATSGVAENSTPSSSLIPSSRSYNSTARLVVSRAFCGAPQCRDKETVPGLTSMPYTIMLIGSILGIATTAMVNGFKKYALLPLKERMCDYVDPTRALSKEGRSLAMRLSIFGAFDSLWFCFLWLMNMGNFVLILHDVITTKSRYDVKFNTTSGALIKTVENLDAPFDKFESIYLRWLNAGSTVQISLIFFCQLLNALVGAAFINKAKIGKEERKKLGDGEKSLLAKLVIPLAHLFGEKWALFMHWFFLPLPLFPIMFTHVIPSAVIFAPTTTFLLGLYLMCGWVFNRKSIKNRQWSKGAQIMWLLLFRIVGNLVFLCLFQTLSGYGQLMYREGPLGHFNWVDVQRTEFQRRSTWCWAISMGNKMQTANLGLATMLLS